MRKRLLCGTLAMCALIAGGVRKFADARVNAAADSNETVLVGAGDIADCTDLSGAEATEKVLAKIPGTVMAIGDLAYPDGSAVAAYGRAAKHVFATNTEGGVCLFTRRTGLEFDTRLVRHSDPSGVVGGQKSGLRGIEGRAI